MMLSRLPVRSSSCCSGVGSFFGGFEQAGDAADLGRHAGRDHHGAAAAVGGDRAREQHVEAVAEADIASRLTADVLRDRQAFAGQRRLVGVEIGILDDAGVRRDLVAGLDQHDVAGDDLIGRDALALAVADDRGFRGGQRHQCAHRFFGARLLEEAEQGVEATIAQDDDGLVRQRGLARILQQPFHHRDDHGDQQDDHQEVLELLEQPPPPGCFRRALEPVRSVLLEAPLRLGAAKPRAASEPSAAITASAEFPRYGMWIVSTAGTAASRALGCGAGDVAASIGF